jgi:hypothetical protein
VVIMIIVNEVVIIILFSIIILNMFLIIFFPKNRCLAYDAYNLSLFGLTASGSIRQSTKLKISYC